MISPLAREDYEDLLAAGLAATLEDFDRLNCIALRITNGAETTAANFPRIGWAGDVPFHQPTCAALSWYLAYVDRTAFDRALKDLCWFYALAHARDRGAFAELVGPSAIRRAVMGWSSGLEVTADEMARACRFAVHGFDDAVPGKTPASAEADKAKTDENRREESLANISERVTVAAAVTGIPPDTLEGETPSRLDLMVEAVRRLNKCEFGEDERKLRIDYDMTLREIRARLKAEKEAANGKEH